jgi:ATP-dependent exoDNAse (exonuclease V) beta subunit
MVRRRLARRPAAPPDLPRYRITPSARDRDAVTAGYVVDRVRSLAAPVALRARTSDWNLVGDVVHAYLAADRPDDTAARRQARGDRILADADLANALDGEALLAMAERLREHVEDRWPGATWEREVPITAHLDAAGGRRRIEGVIDLLLTVPGGVIVVDHKTYPVPSLSAVASRAAELAPQLAVYAAALARCDRTVLGAHLHFPLAGAWVDLRRG